MAAPWKWTQPFFSFGCKSCKQSGCKGRSPSATPIKRKIPSSESKNIRESVLDFTAYFGEINPDIPYLCRRGQSGAKREVFAFSPLFGGSRWKKTLNLRFFAKKQVNFWAVYLLRLKPLIINKNTMVHRQVKALSAQKQTRRSGGAPCFWKMHYRSVSSTCWINCFTSSLLLMTAG